MTSQHYEMLYESLSHDVDKVMKFGNHWETLDSETKILEKNVPYARATVSARDAAVLRTSAPCLYLKNYVAHGLSISKNTQ